MVADAGAAQAPRFPCARDDLAVERRSLEQAQTASVSAGARFCPGQGLGHRRCARAQARAEILAALDDTPSVLASAGLW